MRKKNTTPKTYYTVIARNVTGGTTKKGDQWRKFGLVVQSGPKKGQFLNYFRVVNERTLQYYRKDCKTMGVTSDDPDNFQGDGRVFTAVWALDDYRGPDGTKEPEEKVVAILPYDESKVSKSTAKEIEDAELPF